eukprot:4553924-Prymnesium_polylepis.1
MLRRAPRAARAHLVLVDVTRDLHDFLERLLQRVLVGVPLVGMGEQVLEQHAVARHALHRLDQERAHVEPLGLVVRLAHVEVAVLLLVVLLQMLEVLLRLVVVVDEAGVGAAELGGVRLEDRAEVHVRPVRVLLLQLRQELL